MFTNNKIPLLQSFEKSKMIKSGIIFLKNSSLDYFLSSP